MNADFFFVSFCPFFALLLLVGLLSSRAVMELDDEKRGMTNRTGLDRYEDEGEDGVIVDERGKGMAVTKTEGGGGIVDADERSSNQSHRIPREKLQLHDGPADEEFKEVESVTSVFQWRTGWHARTSQWDCRPTAPLGVGMRWIDECERMGRRERMSACDRKLGGKSSKKEERKKGRENLSSEERGREGERV